MADMLAAYLISAAITTNKIIALVVLLVIIAGGVGAYFWTKSRNAKAA
jgi:hypothetical protein